MEFDGYDTDVVSDFYVGDIISSKLINAENATNISYVWQKSDDNTTWQNIENAISNELQITTVLVNKNIRLNVSYEINGETFTAFSDASPTISLQGDIPHVQDENATIIELNNSEIEGIEPSFITSMALWTKDNNNLSIHEKPSFVDKIILQPVEQNLSTTSDQTDYKPSSESHILLSDDQKLALMEVNGHDNQG